MERFGPGSLPRQKNEIERMFHGNRSSRMTAEAPGEKKRHMKKEFHVCLSHDVDRTKKTFQFATHFLRNLKNGHLRHALYQIESLFRKSHYWCFEKIMEIERKRGLRSTFFFLNETYPFSPLSVPSWRLALGYYDIFDRKVQAIMRELDGQGWEVGLHGSYLSFRNTDLLKKEKSDMESIIGRPVAGVRQHYLNLDQHTWARHAETGFLYDASFGFTNDVGFKEGRFHPFKPIADRNFYVMPLALMDGCIMRKRRPLQEALAVIDIAEEQGACLVLNWHQERFNQKEFPGWMDLYLRLIEECQRRKARFSTIGEHIRDIVQQGNRAGISGGTDTRECND